MSALIALPVAFIAFPLACLGSGILIGSVGAGLQALRALGSARARKA
jgi:hypothetical protein